MSYQDSSFRSVAIDKKTKKVYPFWWGFNPAEKAVNNKGERLEYIFNKTSNSLCVKGDVEAYRNAYDYDGKNPFCFSFNTKDGFSQDDTKGFYKNYGAE